MALADDINKELMRSYEDGRTDGRNLEQRANEKRAQVVGAGSEDDAYKAWELTPWTGKALDEMNRAISGPVPGCSYRVEQAFREGYRAGYSWGYRAGNGPDPLGEALRRDVVEVAKPAQFVTRSEMAAAMERLRERTADDLKPVCREDVVAIVTGLEDRFNAEISALNEVVNGSKAGLSRRIDHVVSDIFKRLTALEQQRVPALESEVLANLGERLSELEKRHGYNELGDRLSELEKRDAERLGSSEKHADWRIEKLENGWAELQRAIESLRNGARGEHAGYQEQNGRISALETRADDQSKRLDSHADTLSTHRQRIETLEKWRSVVRNQS